MKFNCKYIKELSLNNFISNKTTNGLFNFNQVKNLRLRVPPNFNGALIFVGVSWCGHCVQTKPQIEKVAETYGMQFPVFHIDGEKSDNKILLNLLKVQGFPTIFLVNKNGELKLYSGNRNAKDISQEICKVSHNKKTCMIIN